MKITAAKNPKYSREDQSLIDVEIQVNGSDEWLPFTASADDHMEYGKIVFENASSGEYGSIEDFTPPVVDPVAEWNKEMSKAMSDDLEAIIDVLTKDQKDDLDPDVLSKYNDKKTLKQNKPI